VAGGPAPPGEIDLRCDLTRLLPETDPFSRQIMMSHGTFLELLDLAARERGQRAEHHAVPAGGLRGRRLDARPVARVRLRPDDRSCATRCSRRFRAATPTVNAYDLARPVPGRGLEGDGAALHRTQVRLGRVEADSARAAGVAPRHRQAEAWRIELTTPRTMLESTKVLRIGAAEVERHRDGI
jgi:hypothetical protein